VHLQHHTPILQQRSLTCYMHTWPARCCFRLRPQRRASTTPYTHSATAVTHVLHAHMARTLLLPIAAPKTCIYRNNILHPPILQQRLHRCYTCIHRPPPQPRRAQLHASRIWVNNQWVYTKIHLPNKLLTCTTTNAPRLAGWAPRRQTATWRSHTQDSTPSHGQHGVLMGGPIMEVAGGPHRRTVEACMLHA